MAVKIKSHVTTVRMQKEALRSMQLKNEVQIAAYYGRFCGAKRPQCEAERPGFLLI